MPTVLPTTLMMPSVPLLNGSVATDVKHLTPRQVEGTLLPAQPTCVNRSPSRTPTQMVGNPVHTSDQRADCMVSHTVFLGYVGWAAGNFDPSYVLGETPTDNGGKWTDTSLVAACLAPK